MITPHSPTTGGGRRPVSLLLVGGRWHILAGGRTRRASSVVLVVLALWVGISPTMPAAAFDAGPRMLLPIARSGRRRHAVHHATQRHGRATTAAEHRRQRDQPGLVAGWSSGGVRRPGSGGCAVPCGWPTPLELTRARWCPAAPAVCPWTTQRGHPTDGSSRSPTTTPTRRRPPARRRRIPFGCWTCAADGSASSPAPPFPSCWISRAGPPDGRHLVAQIDRFAADGTETGSRIATVRVRDGHVLLLTPFSRFAFHPDWSVRNLIVFATYDFFVDPPRNRTSNIVTIRPDGTQERQLTRIRPGRRPGGPAHLHTRRTANHLHLPG